MKDLPSINQVAILGIVTRVDFKPDIMYKWQLKIKVPSNYRDREAILPCDAEDGYWGKSLRQAKIGKDWVLINGKVRKGGFIQVRDLSIISEVKFHSAIHHVALLGEITAIRNYPDTIYKWQFDLNIYRKSDKDILEATLTCGLSSSEYYDQLMNEASPGQWATVQGKVRNNGFIQVRSVSIFDMPSNE